MHLPLDVVILSTCPSVRHGVMFTLMLDERINVRSVVGSEAELVSQCIELHPDVVVAEVPVSTVVRRRISTASPGVTWLTTPLTRGLDDVVDAVIAVRSAAVELQARRLA